MCEHCDQADLTPNGYLEHVREIIRRSRFAVQGVGGTGSHTDMCYSVGLTAQGLPELVVTGIPAADGARLVQTWADNLLDCSAVLPGETLETGPYRLMAVAVDHPHEHLLVARAIYGDAVRGLQLVAADSRGRWPWDAGYRARQPGQLLLGTPAPRYCDEHRPDRLNVPPHV